MLKSYRITDGENFKLKDFNPGEISEMSDREEAEVQIAADLKKLAALQERFYVDKRRALLIVLQAMDTAGKDGTVDHVFSGINPTGCKVTGFKRPTDEELAHDFLWRAHKEVPLKGQFGIFNRSHYEDVLVVRVHNLVPKDVWKKRYGHILDFERMLADNGTVIVKFFLNISKDEQRQRLQDRLDNKEKLWKFDPGDLKERESWDEYMAAYEDAIRKTAAPHAPWYVIPANKKWYRNLLVARALVKTLEQLDYKLPKLTFVPSEMKVK